MKVHRVNPVTLVKAALLKVCPGGELDKDGWSVENLVKDEVMNGDWTEHWPDQMYAFTRRRMAANSLVELLEFAASSDDVCVWGEGDDLFVWRMTPKELAKGFEALARIHYQMVKEGV